MALANPTCQNSWSDSDGDGWGWENNASCTMPTSTTSNAGSSSNSHHPSCSNSSFDPDGDGYGWENSRTCIVVESNSSGNNSADTSINQQANSSKSNQANNNSSGTPTCSSANSDHDGDGYGWENNRSCLVAQSQQTTSSTSTEENQSQSNSDNKADSSDDRICRYASSDPDGDGWGHENNQSCRVTNNSEGGAGFFEENYGTSYSSSGPASGYPPCPEVFHRYSGQHEGWGYDWSTEDYCDPYAETSQSETPPVLAALGGSNSTSDFQTNAEGNSNSNGLHVCGTKLCNGPNNPIQLTGMSSHGIHWHGWDVCLNDNAMDMMANQWGANLFRIAMYINESKRWLNQLAFDQDEQGNISHVNLLIREANRRGMYALVDYHVLNPGGNPMAEVDRAKRFFSSISSTQRNNDKVIYEIYNEPQGNGATWENIKRYAEQVIPVIRANDPDSVIVVGTEGWSSFGAANGQGDNVYETVTRNPLNFQNIMYAFHFYAASHGDRYVRILDKASNELPVFVTEWGSSSADGQRGHDENTSQRFIDLMRRKQISWAAWNYSGDSGSSSIWQNSCTDTSYNNLKPWGRFVTSRF